MSPKKKAVITKPTPKSKGAAAAAAAGAEEPEAEEEATSKVDPSEPAAKRARKDDAESDEVEKEKDAPKDVRPMNKECFAFHPSDITLNVMPTLGGRVLMALSEGGMQYLIAGARGNIGVKAGRYVFEIKIVEALNPAESSGGGNRGRAPAPRQLVRIGFSTAASALVLGESDQHVFFDSEGNFCVGKKKVLAAQRVTRDQVIGVVLNLDPQSPNANTLSLFREGDRISEPMAIPEELQGQPLFPHISFRNVTCQVLMASAPAKPMPFKCRTLPHAAQADVVVAPKPTPKDGKYDVLLPVALPDEGTFDWLDGFMAKHPNFVELSDRKILEWAAASGMWKPKSTGWKTSNDKPEFNFGLPGMDDLSVRRVLKAISPVVPRNYVIMEVKSNLIKEERSEVLKRFSGPHYRKLSHVVMGEPSEDFKQMQLDKLLKEKQDKADIAWRAKKAENKRKKEIERRQKELATMRKKADEERRKAAEASRKKADEARKKAEEARKKAEEARKKALAEAAGESKAEDDDDKKDEEDGDTKMEVDEEAKEEAKDETKEEEEDVKEEPDEQEDADQEEDQEEDEETEPPKVELTPDEQERWFRPSGGVSDLTSTIMNQYFGSFSIPEKSEGFDEVYFEWQKEEPSKEYLRTWVLEKKRTSRIDNLQPGEWFQDKSKEWSKSFNDWQAKQKVFKSSFAQKEKEAAQKKKEEAEAAKEAGAEGAEPEAKDEEFEEPVEGGDDLDIDAVTDVCDVGNGSPLFKDFGMEDWALMQLRFELYTLQLAYDKDVDDPERIGIHESHLAFYYNKYFKKNLTPKHFGVSSNTELTNLVKDAVTWDDENKVLTSPLVDEVDDFTKFMKVTEEQRRERQRRIDAGDETARLKFSPMALQATAATASKAASSSGGQIRPQGGSWGGGGGSGKQQWARPQGPGAIFPMAGLSGMPGMGGVRGPGTNWVGGMPGWGGGRRW